MKKWFSKLIYTSAFAAFALFCSSAVFAEEILVYIRIPIPIPRQVLNRVCVNIDNKKAFGQFTRRYHLAVFVLVKNSLNSGRFTTPNSPNGDLKRIVDLNAQEDDPNYLDYGAKLKDIGLENGDVIYVIPYLKNYEYGSDGFGYVVPESYLAVLLLPDPVVPEPVLRECSMCWEKIEPDSLFSTPCGHHYHLPCISSWFEAILNNTPEGTKPKYICPYCRGETDAT